MADSIDMITEGINQAEHGQHSLAAPVRGLKGLEEQHPPAVRSDHNREQAVERHAVSYANLLESTRSFMCLGASPHH